MTERRIAMLVGSLRAQSTNLRLARAIEKLAPDNLRFGYVKMDDLPFYNGELEGDRPANVRRFADAIRAADAICCTTPEYNRSIPAVLKNAIDWGSKPPADNVWRDKVFAMTGASPGGIGTAIAQQHLRQILAIQGCIVMPGEAYISFKTPDMILEDGTVTDPSVAAFLTAFAARFAGLIDKMA